MGFKGLSGSIEYDNHNRTTENVEKRSDKIVSKKIFCTCMASCSYMVV